MDDIDVRACMLNEVDPDMRVLTIMLGPTILEKVCVILFRMLNELPMKSVLRAVSHFPSTHKNGETQHVLPRLPTGTLHLS